MALLDGPVSILLQSSLERACRLFKIPSVYSWQADVGKAILEGHDCILSAPTGGGKTLCFYLALLAHWEPGDMIPDHQKCILVVSPLVELMQEQASQLNSLRIPAIALCEDNLSNLNGDALVEFGTGKFRVGFISPEIVKRRDFHSKITSNPNFTSQILAVCFDEAHAIVEWGDSFRADYKEAGGLLRGLLPSGVPILVASATLAPLMIEELKDLLGFRESAIRVEFSNARPNIALSIRPILFTRESFADLRGLLKPDINTSSDIDITLIYFNIRHDAELAADFFQRQLPSTIDKQIVAFYHRHVGSKRKREIIELLRVGKIRLLMATEALGMGIDLRNVARVVLWKVPPSFASLIQRAGRAARLPEVEGEMILYVERSWLRREINTISSQDAVSTLSSGAEHIQTMEGRTELSESVVEKLQRSRKKLNAREQLDIKYLEEFVLTKECRRKPWDNYYNNSAKLGHVILDPTTARCCDNCNPDVFKIPRLIVESAHISQTVRKQSSKDQVVHLTKVLMEWRTLTRKRDWPNAYMVVPQNIMSDDILSRIAKCGYEIHTLGQLSQCVNWIYVEKYGEEIIKVLGEAYQLVEQQKWMVRMAQNPDEDVAEERQRIMKDIVWWIKDMMHEGQSIVTSFVSMSAMLKDREYKRLIKQPMSIAKIHQTVHRTNGYESFGSFAADWHQLFKNGRKWFVHREDSMELYYINLMEMQLHDMLQEVFRMGIWEEAGEVLTSISQHLE